MTSIYLDFNASTPINPAVAAAMRPFLDQAFGNPSSGDWASTPAKAALENARSQVAGLLGCFPDEIVFTSGGSEANNLAIAESRRELRPGEDRMSRQEAGRFVLARLHGKSVILRQSGQ